MPVRNEPHRPLASLKTLRERAGLSQDELAARVSISQSKLSRIERGFLHAKTQECERLAKALGVTVAALMMGAKAAGAGGGGAMNSPRWLSVANAADILDLTPTALRRTLERRAVRSPDGSVEADLDGVRARKFGRLWRVFLDEGWLRHGSTPEGDGRS